MNNSVGQDSGVSSETEAMNGTLCDKVLEEGRSGTEENKFHNICKNRCQKLSSNCLFFILYFKARTLVSSGISSL